MRSAPIYSTPVDEPSQPKPRKKRVSTVSVQGQRRRTRSHEPYQQPASDASDLLLQSALNSLQQRRQWCGFRIVPQPKGKKPKKIPVVAPDAQGYASATDPTTWRTFAEACRGLINGRYTAVGYAIAGDVIGIDLDGERWVTANKTLTEEGKRVVDRFSSYAEWSISSKGIHILVLGLLPVTGRINRKLGLEVYSSDRLFILTGRHLEETPVRIERNQDALDWLLTTYFVEPGPTEPPEAIEKTEDTEQMTSVISACPVETEGSCCSVDQIISETLPIEQGERNSCILRLARGLRFDAGMANTTFIQLKPIVRRWHAQAFATIGTKDFDETWADFVRAWKIAKVPLNFDARVWALRKAKAEPLPPEADDYDTLPVRLLLGMCWQLASLGHQGRFFLSSHEAGAALGVSHDKAYRWLGMFCADGIVQIVERGNQRRATRYRWIGRTESPDQNVP